MLYFPSDFSLGTYTVIRDLFAAFGTCTLKKTSLVLGLCVAQRKYSFASSTKQCTLYHKVQGLTSAPLATKFEYSNYNTRNVHRDM